MGPGQTDSKDKPSVSEPVKSRESDELVKQEMLVQYLQDAYSFSLKITEAISIISKMMYENTTTGVPASLSVRTVSWGWKNQSCLYFIDNCLLLQKARILYFRLLCLALWSRRGMHRVFHDRAI